MRETVVQSEPMSPGHFGSPSPSVVGGRGQRKATAETGGDYSRENRRRRRTSVRCLWIAAASINTIIENGNLTKGAIYFHFSSKEELAQQVIERWSDMVNDEYVALGEAGDRSPYRQLVRFCSEMAHRIDADPILRAGLLLTVEPSVTGGKTAYMKWHKSIDELVVRSIESGEISDRPASYRLSDQVCATFIGGAQLHSVDVGSPNLRTRIVDVFDGLTGGPD